MNSRLLYLRFARIAWPVFLALSPLALVAGIWLMLRVDPNMQPRYQIDRDEAITIARQTAQAKGLDVSDWGSYCMMADDSNRYFYYRLRNVSTSDPVRQLANEVSVQVMLRAPDGKQRLEVEMTTQGRVIRYSRFLPPDQNIADPGEPETRRLAEAAFRAHPASSEIPATNTPVKEENVTPGGVTRRYIWNWPVPDLPELERRVVIAVKGSTVVREAIEANIQKEFADKNLNSSFIGVFLFGVIYGLGIFLILGFGVFRFVQRARQKEVSYWRLLLLGLLSASAFAFYSIQTDVATYQGVAQNSPMPPLVGVIISCVMFLLMGLFVGVAYASGEGDIREAYPGKLTSLDALLTGKIFSRNVARSIIYGTAVGCWGLFFVELAASFWAHNPLGGWQVGKLDSLFAVLPWTTTLYGWTSYSILLSVAGLLLPLPFLLRRLRNQIVIGTILFLLTLGAATPYMALMRPWAAVFLASAGLAFTLLVTFFKFDLQAAFISVGIYPLVVSIGHFLVQPSASLRQAGIISTVIVLSVTAVAAFFFFKGRLYTEDQVRPLYARNLAERLSMQAEVSAAREAQIRLLPQTLPSRSTLTIAAACLPAHEVGGDFYDIFELDENRLALFMAEGDGKGLASALSIAFAKGYLMPKIKGTGRADDSPSEIVRSLQKRLATTMAGEGTPGFIYAVLDTSEGTLRYARTGNAPNLVVSRAGRDESLQRPAEHEIQFPLDTFSGETIKVLAGSCDVGVGDSLLLLTDGILKVWRETDQPATAAFWKTLMSHHSNSGHHLRDALDHTMKEGHKQSERKGIVDDLTAIVVRIEKSFASQPAKDDSGNVEKILKEAVEQA